MPAAFTFCWAGLYFHVQMPGLTQQRAPERNFSKNFRLIPAMVAPSTFSESLRDVTRTGTKLSRDSRRQRNLIRTSLKRFWDGAFHWSGQENTKQQFHRCAQRSASHRGIRKFTMRWRRLWSGPGIRKRQMRNLLFI